MTDQEEVKKSEKEGGDVKEQVQTKGLNIVYVFADNAMEWNCS